MATKSESDRKTKTQLTKLEAEVAQLRVENAQLKKAAAPKPSRTFSFKPVGAVLLLCFAVALLVAGNLLFWTGNTIVKNDRFVAATAPIIRNTNVQHAIADRATNRLFETVDVQQVVTDVLPPRADFLAPSIANGLKSQTNNQLDKILANPKFQDTWNDTLSRAHTRFIASVEKNGSDGSIDISEVYTSLSANLQGTKLSFLANKKLPAKIGNIPLVHGEWVKVLNRVITHIDLWRILAIGLFLICAVVGVWLSKNRRRAVVLLGILSALAMFITLVSLRVTRELAAGQAQPQYAAAVRDTVQIVFHPLVVQTTSILVAFALVAFIAWVSGPGRAASGFRARTSDLLAGKLHQSIFSTGENTFTLWLGRFKRYIEWTLVALLGIIFLTVRLTPKALLWYGFALVLLILIVETLAAKTLENRKVIK